MMTKIDFSVYFGGTLIEIQCPGCGQCYSIVESELEQGFVTCWNNSCHRTYLQKGHSTKTPKFVRDAFHRVKGES